MHSNGSSSRNDSGNVSGGDGSCDGGTGDSGTGEALISYVWLHMTPSAQETATKPWKSEAVMWAVMFLFLNFDLTMTLFLNY